jgi:hypothetical protein
MTSSFAGQLGHGSTAFLRNQPVRIVDGRVDGGYTGVYEFICPGCGDHPYMDYDEVPPRLQRLRGPDTPRWKSHVATAQGRSAAKGRSGQRQITYRRTRVWS